MSMRIIYTNYALDASLLYYGTGGGNGSDAAGYQLSNIVNGRIHPEARIIINGSYLRFIIEFDFGAGYTNIEGCIIANPNFNLSNITLILKYNTVEDPWTGFTNYIIEGVGSEDKWQEDDNHIWGIASDSTISTMQSANPRYWFLVGQSLLTDATIFIPEVWFFKKSATLLPQEIILPSANDNLGGSYQEIKTSGGNIFTKVDYKGRNFSRLRWEYLTSTELQKFRDLHAACYPNGTFWIFYDTNDPVFCYYRNKQLSIESMGVGYYAVDIIAEEVPVPQWLV